MCQSIGYICDGGFCEAQVVLVSVSLWEACGWNWTVMMYVQYTDDGENLENKMKSQLSLSSSQGVYITHAKSSPCAVNTVKRQQQASNMNEKLAGWSTTWSIDPLPRQLFPKPRMTANNNITTHHTIHTHLALSHRSSQVKTFPKNLDGNLSQVRSLSPMLCLPPNFSPPFPCVVARKRSKLVRCCWLTVVQSL